MNPNSMRPVRIDRNIPENSPPVLSQAQCSNDLEKINHSSQLRIQQFSNQLINQPPFPPVIKTEANPLPNAHVSFPPVIKIDAHRPFPHPKAPMRSPLPVARQYSVNQPRNGEIHPVPYERNKPQNQ